MVTLQQKRNKSLSHNDEALHRTSFNGTGTNTQSGIKMEKSAMRDCAIAKNDINPEAGPFFKKISKLVFFWILGLQCEADPKKR